MISLQEPAPVVAARILRRFDLEFWSWLSDHERHSDTDTEVAPGQKDTLETKNWPDLGAVH